MIKQGELISHFAYLKLLECMPKTRKNVSQCILMLFMQDYVVIVARLSMTYFDPI